MRSPAAAVARAGKVGGAFLYLGWSTAIKYPLGFVSEQIRVLGPVVVYFFIAGFVEVEPAAVGGDYFTFVMVGLVALQTLNAGLRALTNQIDLAVSRGFFETILAQPLRWNMLPYAMAAWPILNATVAALVVSVTALILGATIDFTGVLPALVVAALGILAGLAIGALASSVKVLAKRGDPVLTFYSLGALILSGVYFPIDQIPESLQWTSYLFVQTYVVAGMRHALLPEKSGLTGPTGPESIVVLALVVIILTPASIWAFARAMRFGRRMGLLAGY